MRLISFLGIGERISVGYRLDGGEPVQSPHCVVALATALARTTPVDEVVLIGTDDAFNSRSTPEIRDALASVVPRIRDVRIPNGQSPEEQWVLFDALRAILKEPASDVVIDVTHGWRAQPIVVVGVIGFLRATGQLDGHAGADDAAPINLRLLYGAFERGQPEAQIWDLTSLVELGSWTAGIGELQRSGRSPEVVSRLEVLRRRLGKSRNLEGSTLLNAVQLALKEFGDDFATIRTSRLLGPAGSAAKARAALHAARGILRRELPPLESVIESVELRLATLADASPERPIAGLASLARTYFDSGRFAEAISVIREGWISRSAPVEFRVPPDGPRTDTFKEGRLAVEKTLGEAEPGDWAALAQVRNTVDHADFDKSGLRADKVISGIGSWLQKFETAAAADNDRK